MIVPLILAGFVIALSMILTGLLALLAFPFRRSAEVIDLAEYRARVRR